MNSVSPTKINMYVKCPQMCYYYIKKAPHRYIPALEIGKNIHSIIEKYYEIIPSKISPSSVMQFIKRAINESGFRIDVILSNNIDEIERFADFEKWRIKNKIGNPKYVEKAFSKDVFYGIIDCMLDGNEKIVVDWKTGYMYGVLNTDMIRQGLIYKYITGADDVIFVFLSSKNGTIFKRLGKRAEFAGITIDKLRNIANDIINGKFYRREGSICNSCMYNITCNLDKRNMCLWDIKNL